MTKTARIWRGIIGGAGVRSTPASAPYCAAIPASRSNGTAAVSTNSARVRSVRCSAHYDLVVFDHPFIGEIARGRADGAVRRLSCRRSSTASSSAIRSASPGRSYAGSGRQWALPIDAACQVASYRPDLLAALWRGAAHRHDEVLELGRRARKDGKWLGLPSGADRRHVPAADAWRSAGGGRGIHRTRQWSSRPSASCASLRRYRIRAHRQWNPIRCYDHMIANDDVVYVPFAFGYVNYASQTDDAASALRRRADAGCGRRLARRRRHRRQRPVEAYAKRPSTMRCFLCSPAYAARRLCRSRRPAGLAGGLAGRRGQCCYPAISSPTRCGPSSRPICSPTHPGFIAFFRESAPRVGRGHRRRNVGGRTRRLAQPALPRSTAARQSARSVA